jgi:hypothetical protein
MYGKGLASLSYAVSVQITITQQTKGDGAIDCSKVSRRRRR